MAIKDKPLLHTTVKAPSLSEGTAWRALSLHAEQMASFSVAKALENDPHRFDSLSKAQDSLFIDFSKHQWDNKTVRLLTQLAEQQKLKSRIDAMFSGFPINQTEQQPALHTALRESNSALKVDDVAIQMLVDNELARIKHLSQEIQEGKRVGHTGKPFTDIVLIGVGGSLLGPKLVLEALDEYKQTELKAHFISTMDGLEAKTILSNLRPESTLFIVASKSFTTHETMVNAEICKQWLNDKFNASEAYKQHFIGISAQEDKMNLWGIEPDYQLKLWSWVGGRYSVWSSISLIVPLCIGFEHFQEFLAGAHSMDQHFKNTPIDHNIPALMGLLHVWNRNFLKFSTQVIAPYDYRLRSLPKYLSQLEMESSGKQTNYNGQAVDYDTGAVVFGELGHNSQHSYFQALHQGTEIIPVDFIAILNQPSHGEHKHLSLINALSQAETLMAGKSYQEAESQLKQQGKPPEIVANLIQHATHPGNRPSSMMLIENLTPQSLGSLLALYEHKVFTQCMIWDINPFDQFGVEQGKWKAKQLVKELDVLLKETESDQLSIEQAKAFIKQRSQHS